ncbi:MAG: hypothetical protein ABSG53_29285, partial [Thermoguttaceae bacterium]
MQFGSQNLRTVDGPLCCWAFVVVWGGIVGSVAQAQIHATAPSSQFELSETVQFDRADRAALA